MMSLVNPGIFAPIPYLLLVTIFLVVAEKTTDDVPQRKGAFLQIPREEELTRAR
jgi:hypothetical protein